MQRSNNLPVIQLDKPCRLPWSDLIGDDKTRFCTQCRLHVHNLSAMTSEEAAQFLANRSGRTCVAFAPSANGAPMTLDYAPAAPVRAKHAIAAGLAVAAAATAIAFAHVSAKSPATAPTMVGMLPLPSRQITTAPSTNPSKQDWAPMLMGEIAPSHQPATEKSSDSQ